MVVSNVVARLVELGGSAFSAAAIPTALAMPGPGTGGGFNARYSHSGGLPFWSAADGNFSGHQCPDRTRSGAAGIDQHGTMAIGQHKAVTIQHSGLAGL